MEDLARPEEAARRRAGEATRDERSSPAAELDLVGPVARRWRLLVLVTVAAAVLGLLVSVVTSPVYRGSASLLVGDFDTGEVSINDVRAMESLTATYADIARREPVLAGAARDVGLGDWRQLRDAVHVRVPDASPQVIEISVEGEDREQVKHIAGVVATRLVDYFDETSGGNDFVGPQLRKLEELITEGEGRVDQLRAEQTEAGATAPSSLQAEIDRTQAQVTEWRNNYASFKELTSPSSSADIRVLDQADVTREPIRPSILLNTAIAGGAGFLLALAVIHLLEGRQRRPEGGGEHATGSEETAPAGASPETTPQPPARHDLAPQR